MVAPVIDLKMRRRIRNLEKSIKELELIEISVKNAMNNLTKWRDYRYISVRLDDLFNTYTDIKRNISSQKDRLRVLQIRDVE